MPIAPVAEQQLHKLLSSACARNQPIEVHYDTIQGQAQVAKSRFFRMEDGWVLIDRPTIQGALAKIPPESTMTAS